MEKDFLIMKKILVLNAGSSSQKSCLYQLDNKLPETAPHPLWEAQIDWKDRQNIAELKVKTDTGITNEQTIPSESRSQDTEKMLHTLCNGDTQVIDRLDEIDIVGHRIVHGGQEYQQSTLVNQEVKDAIDRLAIFAPIHNRVNLEGIKAIEQLLGDIPQVAVFDTAFHANLPPSVYIYPLPYQFLERGIRRYGFHGISHQYCADRAARILNRDLSDLQLITCHLGNGCSIAAISNGYSIDTSMGFTPLEGLMMGTRSGSIDPGILIHLLRTGEYTADSLDRLLNRESGLLGLSGISNDFREIFAAIERGEERAKLATDVYIHRLRSQIGAMLPSLERLDALVFTAGAGENNAYIREKACEAFAFLDLKIDRNLNHDRPVDCDIATPDSKVRVLVIHTQEDWAIARECWQFLLS
jgi:acetate kinase